MPVEVPFVYEIETNSDYSDEEMNGNILPKVEQAMGDGILPLIFDECASDDGDDDVSTLLSFVGEHIMGIAASPPDLAISDETASCSVIQPQLGNSCTVVEGIMTVYVPQKDTDISETDNDVIIMATQDAIREVMESGMLDDGAIHESIESVSYGQDGSYQPTVTLGTDENEPNEGGGGSLAYIAIAGGAVLVGAVLAIVGAKMRSRQDEDEDDYDSDEDDEDENDDHDMSGFHDNPTEIADRDGKRTYDMGHVTGEDWAAVGTTAAVLASASGTSAADDREEFFQKPKTLLKVMTAPAVLSPAKSIAENDDIQSERSDVSSVGASEAGSESSIADDASETASDESVADTEIMSNKLNDIV